MSQQVSVYWIRLPEHTDMFSQGYIGVSKNVKTRWARHEKDSLKNKHENAHLANAILKYGKNLIKEVILIASEEYCYVVEKLLREKENVGWNLNIGGTKPPISKYRGDNYISPLKGKSRPTPWLIGKFIIPPSIDACKRGGMKRKGIKQTPEQIAKRVASRKATLQAQGRTR